VLSGKVDTIIVNFRTKELTLDAALSVIDEPETSAVLVVENGSGDDSAAWLTEKLAGTKANVLISKQNLGFGGGNNLGIRAATSEYVFLLNSDATIQPGALGLLLKKMADPAVGIAAPAIYLPGGEEMQRDVLGYFPTPARILSRNTDCPIDTLEPDWVSGAAMLLRRVEVLELGGFDEQLFMYLEDVDLCRRYRDRSLRAVRELSAKVVHLGGGSKASSKSQKEQFRRSTDYYLEKHGFSGASRATVRAVRAVYARLRGL
jgi:N-acetylglucosaminyl-diphospho-decaprenol L-rhamnosyltransferase